MGPIRVGATYLTLSEEVGPGREDARVDLLPVDAIAAVRFETLLELHERAELRGDSTLAEAYADRIIDEMSAGSAA